MVADGEPPTDEAGARAEANSTPADEAVVAAAVEAAEEVIFSRYRSAEIRDLDVTVRFEDGVLEVDVYLNVPGAEDAERIADEAAVSGRVAVDDLLE